MLREKLKLSREFQLMGAEPRKAAMRLAQHWMNMAKILSLFLFATGLFAVAGCAFFAKRPPSAAFVAFQKSGHVRPGGALVVETVLISSSETSLKLPVLNPENVKFWVTNAEGGNFQTLPVISAEEDLAKTDTLEAGGAWRRSFVLPTAAETTTGVLTWQALYSPQFEPAEPGISFPLATDPLEFRVAGRREFHRDAQGRISAADAAQAARKETLADPLCSAVVEPVEHGKGFWDWRVAFYHRETGKFEGAKLVNPYLGHVRSENSPGLMFESQQKTAKPPGRM